ncbi:MAG: peptidoglycan-binding domain-containing protein [Chitinophagales bacterium]
MDNKNIILLICMALTISFLFASCHASKKAKNAKNAIKTDIPIDESENETESETATFVPTEKETTAEDNIEAAEVAAKYSFENEATLKKTQVLLFLSGYAPGRVDGLMKEQTMQAISSFQNDHELTIGDMTSKTLNDIGVAIMDFEVSDVQEALEKKGYDPGPIDNLVGNMTRTAYSEFLQNNKFPFNRFTTEIKTALFSDDPKYRNTNQADALFNETPSTTLNADVSNIQFVPLTNAKIQDIQRALFAKGYDAGANSETMNPQIEDALFKYQVDKKLPVGGLNEDTLRSLGFK